MDFALRKTHFWNPFCPILSLFSHSEVGQVRAPDRRVVLRWVDRRQAERWCQYLGALSVVEMCVTCCQQLLVCCAERGIFRGVVTYVQTKVRDR